MNLRAASLLLLTTSAPRCPADGQSTHFGLGAELTVVALWFLRPPNGLQLPHSQNRNKFSRGRGSTIQREAVCFGSCRNTKYSSESGVAGARLICPSREDYIARPWRWPAEPLLTLRKGAGERGGLLSDTTPNLIIFSHLSGTPSVSGQSQRCTQ